MKIALIQIGKTTQKFISSGVEEYAARIRKYVPYDIITIQDLRNTKNMPVDEQKLKEGEKICRLLGKEDYVIFLDERGKELSTFEFSEQLGKLFLVSRKRVVFVIGGSYGFSAEAIKRADLKLSLSKMTFSHQVVRLLFAEQLYRILSLMKGEPYHHE